MVELKGTKARATRERLLREATQLFSVKGYFHTTVDDVLARARITKGGFYAHFDSKEALVRSAIDHATTMWFDKIVASVMATIDPRAQLSELVAAYRRYAIDRTFDGGCFFVNLAAELDDQHDELRALVDARFAQLRVLVADIVERAKAQGTFRDDTPAAAVATMLVGSLTGTMMLAKAAGSFDAFDDTTQMLERFLSSFEVTR